MRLTRQPWGGLLALMAMVALAAACGGVDSGGTGLSEPTHSSGTISGFGSIIVNGVRFDDSVASIVDDDGVSHVNTDLKLGMVVDVEGVLHGNRTDGVARTIQFGNEIAGPVESVDKTTGRMVVLGQVVQVDTDTVFSGYAAGLADVAAGNLVEVFAFLDPATSVYVATRVELKSTLAVFKLRGIVSQLSAASFAIGGATIDYGAIAPAALPQLANGLSVRVSLQTLAAAGHWVATSVHAAQRKLPEAEKAELDGFIGGFLSSANFQVSGMPVDASGPGVDFRHGSVGQLANGVRVEAEGPVRNGVLVATTVDFRQAGGGNEEFELHGAIESMNATAKTFVVRGVNVTYDSNTKFAAGTVAQLATGAQVEVKGALSAGGTGVLAGKIRFEK